jgi:SAM-dependent methyltransferase
MTPALSRRMGRTLFGANAEAYDAARPPYPPRVFEVLESRCGLARRSAVFEVGPGTGKATRELLRRGADPVVAIEPDVRMARFLLSTLGAQRSRVHVVVAPFEEATLPEGAFDLGVAATSFHWTHNERHALRRAARWLKPGGWWAMWWNHHGDPARPSRFHRAIQPLYRKGRTQGWAGWVVRGRDRSRNERDRRLHRLRELGPFDRIRFELIRSPVRLSTDQTRALWASFSDISTLPPRRREEFLSGLARIADEEFGGRVEFSVVTSLYTARRV